MMKSATTIFPPESSAQTGLYSIKLSTTKRKRRPAGTPDPDAEVVALSPHTLLESDSYVCEICNQGFQRDQNLQMHRRRHKVPWKLLKRAEPELHKRVYVCPEPSCLHHNPCHALGDMVGIKKHYRRKHSSVKQWKCYRCSKAYAVQSDYKAHVKICGTRGHCCDCGRVFSRIESFIEHQDTCTSPGRNASNNGAEAVPTLHKGVSESRSSKLLHLLQGQVSAVPAFATSGFSTKTHACKAIPSSIQELSSSVISSASPALLRQPSPHQKALFACSVQDERAGQPCISLSRSSYMQHDRGPELQLLNSTSKAFSNQGESSDTQLAEEKCIQEHGVDYLQMLPLSSRASCMQLPATPAVRCNLQLSIGMISSHDQGTVNVERASLNVAMSVAKQAEKLARFNSTHAARPAQSPFFLNSDAKDQSQLVQHCSSMHRPVAAALDETTPDRLHAEHFQFSYGSIREPQSALTNLQREIRASRLSFLVDPDNSMVPAACNKAAEAFLQEGREKLTTASAEKLESDNAWNREARRERELAEQEYNLNEKVRRAGKLGDNEQLALQRENGKGGTKGSPCGSSTSSSSGSCVASTQAPTTFLQLGRMHAEGMVMPNCITCPTQIVYPSPATAGMSTFFP